MDNLAAFPNRAAIKDEAGAWIARIDQGPLSDTDARDLQAWVRRSDFHRDYLLKLAANWDDMGVLQELAQLFPLPETEPHRQHAPSAVEQNTPSAAGQHATSAVEQHTSSAAGQHMLSTAEQHAPSAAEKAPPRHKNTFFWPAMATAIAASLLVAVFVFTQNAWFSINEPHDYTTAIGEQARYTLKDGTTVSLNTNSQLTVDYTGTRRAVTLVRGEASFDVAKNPQRPFVVYAGGGMVWAVGTAFNVRYLAEGVDVIVTEGKVKVFSEIKPESAWPNALADAALPHRPDGEFGGAESGADGKAAMSGSDAISNSNGNTGGGSTSSNNGSASGSNYGSTSSNRGTNRASNPASKEALLGAGQAIRYSQTIETLQPVAGEELTRKLAWQRGSLIFKGETLEQALTEIARYTDKELIIVDPAITHLEIGGHYKTDDINLLLAALGQGLNIKVEQVSDRRIQLSAK